MRHKNGGEIRLRQGYGETRGDSTRSISRAERKIHMRFNPNANMTLLAEREASYSVRSGECSMPKRKRRRFSRLRPADYAVPSRKAKRRKVVDEAALCAMKRGLRRMKRAFGT